MDKQRNGNTSPDARRTAIIELLNADGEQSVESLASRFHVSGMTIRRDLADLAQFGQIIRTHGGAAPAARISFEFKFLEKSRQQTAEKEQIASLAVARVRAGQTVLLDSGTTTLAIARRLRTFPSLTVLTSSLPIASELFGCGRITTILLGGQLRQESPDLMGSLTERMVEILRADIAFLGADGIDTDGNLYNTVPEVGALLQKMAGISKQVFAVADHTKIGCTNLMCYANLREWAGLICDAGLDEKMANQLRRSGAQLIQHGSAQGNGQSGRAKAAGQ